MKDFLYFWEYQSLSSSGICKLVLSMFKMQSLLWSNLNQFVIFSMVKRASDFYEGKKIISLLLLITCSFEFVTSSKIEHIFLQHVVELIGTHLTITLTWNFQGVNLCENEGSNEVEDLHKTAEATELVECFLNRE